MQLYDILIIVVLALFAISGFKRGFFKSLISFVGFIIVIALAYSLKNIVGDFFVLNLPFFKFNQFLGGALCLNIVLYQFIAFLIALIILSLIYKIIVTITGIFEKILKMTIILGIPSKILGLIIGFVEGYIVVYLFLFFLSQPFWQINLSEQSNYAPKILENTPILSKYGEKSLEVYNEIKELITIKESSALDLQMADIILKEKITSPDVMQKLVDSGKIKADDIESVINKYR